MLSILNFNIIGSRFYILYYYVSCKDNKFYLNIVLLCKILRTQIIIVRKSG